MDERQPVLRRLYAHRLVLLQFRLRRDRPAAGARDRDPGRLPRAHPRDGVHRGIHPAGHRWLGQQPRGAAPGARPAAPGGLDSARAPPGGPAGPALRIRDPAPGPDLRARGAALCAVAGAPGHLGARAHGRSRAVPGAHRRLRLRHDGGRPGPGLLPGQRAARLLEQCQGARERQPQRRRHRRPGDRRAGGAGHRRPQLRRAGGAHPRAGPRAAAPQFRRAALAQPQLPHRLLGQVRPPGAQPAATGSASRPPGGSTRRATPPLAEARRS